jgi:uncharacterized membrane protein
VGLCLFGVVGLKVFLVDLAMMEPLYRIVAFLILGVLVLGGAYRYLRNRSAVEERTLKVIDDELAR